MSRGLSTRIDVACLVAFGLSAGTVTAAEHEFRGQVSGWHIESRDEGERFYNGGIRYIPQYTFWQAIDDERFFDLDISMNAWAAFGSASEAEDADLELYRLTFRVATPQTETRVGLQKINFGPAFLLRALMWFDSLDPRDPLQFTEGVYALRFRYVAMNNASLSLWGLYGNDEPKGYEILPSEEERPEFGGRLQYPVPGGEIAFTFHNREVNGAVFYMADFIENRFALDGRWDIEIGLWFEAVLQQQNYHDIFIAAVPDVDDVPGVGGMRPFKWSKIMTIGADYTFDTGNGLHVLCEHNSLVLSDEAFGCKEDQQTSAYSINYPIGYLDNLSVIGFYSWEQKDYYQYIAWQRTWDDLIIKLGLFYYPDASVSGGLYARRLPGMGYGGQLTVIYNH
jgi:hypothetical protein